MTTQMVQIRDVPVDQVDELKSRAARRGLSLSDFLRIEIDQLTQRPDMQEVLARLGSGPRRHLDPSPTRVLREIRDEDDS